jgi:phage gpG-like protein
LAKRNQINKKNKQTLQALVQLMKDIDQKYSIKVGIIGDKAYQKHEDSDLTNAELGAVHEFGCTINVTEKMRAYLHHIGIHLRKDTTSVVIPTRSFLRMPLLSDEFKNYLMTNNEIITIFESRDFTGKTKKQMAHEINVDQALIIMEKHPSFMQDLANWIGAQALVRVQDAFNTGGFGKWAPISEVTKEHRLKDKTSPPLTDTGELRNSITAEVKKVK